jgi:hypothetical protein
MPYLWCSENISDGTFEQKHLGENPSVEDIVEITRWGNKATTVQDNIVQYCTEQYITDSKVY